jgi:HAD superfamily hydrolase (TIGR01549 family)
MIKIVSFDMDGTLVTSRYVERVWLEGVPSLYARRHGLGLEEAQKIVYDEYMSIGTRDLRWYDLSHWLERFEIDIAHHDLLEMFRADVELYPETEEVLALLSEKFDLVVASNGATEFVEFELDGLRHHFREILSVTSVFGKVKDYPETFLDLCKYLGAKPEEVVHIGDHRYFDYEVPKEAGLSALYLDRERMESGAHVVHDLLEAAERVMGM